MQPFVRSYTIYTQYYTLSLSISGRNGSMNSGISIRMLNSSHTETARPSLAIAAGSGNPIRTSK